MIIGMKSSLLSRIIWTCPHQFTWPRREESGAYYQLCVNCGSKYRYDWKQMRRSGLVENDLPAETRRSHRQPKVTWTARDRRLRHVVPVSFCASGSETWISGTSENLSRSGLLFRSESELAVGISMEIKLEMPEELTGDSAADVTCKATVARVTPVTGKGKEPEAFLIACTIEDYDFGKKPVEGTAADAKRHELHPAGQKN
jgi:hypothetical protein